MELFTRSIPVGRTRLFRHLDPAVRHERTLQRLVCLEAHNLLQILHLFIDVSRAVCRQAGYNLCLHIENAAFGALFLLELLQLSP